MCVLLTCVYHSVLFPSTVATPPPHPDRVARRERFLRDDGTRVRLTRGRPSEVRNRNYVECVGRPIERRTLRVNDGSRREDASRKWCVPTFRRYFGRADTSYEHRTSEIFMGAGPPSKCKKNCYFSHGICDSWLFRKFVATRDMLPGRRKRRSCDSLSVKV